MNSQEIQRLVKIVEESTIAELEVSKWWGRKVKILKYSRPEQKNGSNDATYFTGPVAMPPQQVAAPAPTAVEPAAAAPSPAPRAGEEFKSPMVGTFYRAPAPDADAYVKPGDSVQKGQVVCIVEAMKLMNEVEAEYPCKILELLVENGQPVEYNQPLFLVEKL